MYRTYIIAWKSKLRASPDQVNKLITREEDESQAWELNHDHPNFVHEPRDIGASCEVQTPDRGCPSRSGNIINLHPDESAAEPNAAVDSQVIIENIDFGSSTPETRNTLVLEKVAN